MRNPTTVSQRKRNPQYDILFHVIFSGETVEAMFANKLFVHINIIVSIMAKYYHRYKCFTVILKRISIV